MRQTWPAWGASQGVPDVGRFVFFPKFLGKGPRFRKQYAKLRRRSAIPFSHETTLEFNNQVI
jgi:hypothetical protein